MARFFAAIYSRGPGASAVPLEVNAAPAMLVTSPRLRHLLALDADAGGIRRIFVVANPDKLTAADSRDGRDPG